MSVCSVVLALLLSLLTGADPAITGPELPDGSGRVVTENMVATDSGPTAGAVEGASARVAVPVGAVPYGMTVQLTTADRAAVRSKLQSMGYSEPAVAAVAGVRVSNPDGSRHEGPFDRPVRLTLTGAGIRAGWTTVWIGSGEMTSTITDRHATVSVTGNGTVVVLAS